MGKVFITAALTGSIHTPSMSESLPITPDEIAQDAVRAYEAGAALVHVHARNPQTGQPVSDLDLFEEICRKIKERCPIVIIPTTGGGLGMTIEERVSLVPKLKPEMATFNMGSYHVGIFKMTEKMGEYKFDWEENYINWTGDWVFQNTFKTLRTYAEAFLADEVKPECEIYDVSMINHVAWLINEGLLKKPPHLQFVMGLFGGMPATVDNVLFLYNTAVRQLMEFTWSVAAAGRDQIRLCTMAMCMGGHARVGLEDSLYAGKGRKATCSADQVEMVVRIARELSLDIGSPEEARKAYGLKGLDRTSF
jgi:uncharacterized protein (DUF849 family)